MHAPASSSPARTPDGRFAPGQSGNPAGRPKGAKGRGRRLVDVLREGEEELILRGQIERALSGDAVAGRFCAQRIDAAARIPGDDDTVDLGFGMADVLNPFVLHAKLVHAVATGRLGARHALAVLDLLAAKKHISTYTENQIDDEDWRILHQEDDPGGEDEPEPGAEGSEEAQAEKAEEEPPPPELDDPCSGTAAAQDRGPGGPTPVAALTGEAPTGPGPQPAAAAPPPPSAESGAPAPLGSGSVAEDAPEPPPVRRVFSPPLPRIRGFYPAGTVF